MVTVCFTEDFKKEFQKIKDKKLKERIIKQLSKIKDNPSIGKPMRFSRRGTRELYISPFRLSYSSNGEKIFILTLYHKDNQ